LFYPLSLHDALPIFAFEELIDVFISLQKLKEQIRLIHELSKNVSEKRAEWEQWFISLKNIAAQLALQTEELPTMIVQLTEIKKRDRKSTRLNSSHVS